MAFFVYALAFSDMLYRRYGSIVLVGTLMLVVCLLVFIAKQGTDYDEAVVRREKLIHLFVRAGADYYFALQDAKKVVEDLQKKLDDTDDTKPKDKEAVIKDTISDLYKILSNDSSV